MDDGYMADKMNEDLQEILDERERYNSLKRKIEKEVDEGISP